MKPCIKKALQYLEHSFRSIPQELNKLDWKENLSPNNDKLCRHLSVFANHPGGGFLVFGIDDIAGKVIGISRENSNEIIKKLANLFRDKVDTVVMLDHSIEEFHKQNVLIVYIKESAIKPVHIARKSIEESFIRSGSTTRKASRQEIGGMTNASLRQRFGIHD